MSECPEFVHVDQYTSDAEGGILACWLPIGHDGPHYDKADNVTWKIGKPDAVQ